MAETQPRTPTFDAKAQAKRLIRTAREASLATLERSSGAPFATLVGLASDYDGAPLLLLSTLSSHTKNLSADSRASLLLTSPRSRGDPLNRPRLTLVGPLARHDEPSAKARYIARNPKAKLYAGFGDFAIFRMDVATVHFNGGFARAAPLTPRDVATDLAGAEALLRAEPELLTEINARGPSYLAQCIEGGSRTPRWRAIGLDPEGLDLGAGASVARIMFAKPAVSPAAWIHALEKCAQ
jgi:heme iron utilization protein